MRRKRLETPPATVAHEVLAVRLDLPSRFRHVVARMGHPQHAAAERQGVFHGAGDPRSGVGANRHAVDHHLDVVPSPAVDLRRLIDRVGPPIDANPHVAGRAGLFPERFVAFADADFQRGHQVELRAGRQGHDLGDDLVGRLAADRHAARGQCGWPEPRHQNPQIIVNLRDRAHRAPRRMAEVLLLDGHGGRKPLDVLDLRLLHLPDELPGVGAEAFDVSPLPFGVDRVHRQRAFSRSARPAADRQPVAWNIDVDVFEIMLRRAADANASESIRPARICAPATAPVALHRRDRAAFAESGRCTRQSRLRFRNSV